MPQDTPKPSEQDDQAKQPGSEDNQDLEQAQEDAAQEREDEGGYQ